MSLNTELQFPLISVNFIATERVHTINARELHQFLEVESHFKDWIKRRIEKYGFVENSDFITSAHKRALGLGLGYKDYFLTIDMAKELAMVERNHKGRLARQHFINAEKMVLHSAEQVISLQNQVSQLQDLIPLDNTDRQIIQLKGFTGPQGKTLTNAQIGAIVSLSKDRVRARLRKLEAIGKITPPANLAQQQQAAKYLPNH